jgi:hypothetical protein
MLSGASSAGNGAGLTLNDLPRPQKIAVIIFAILAVVIVVFWIWQIRAQINQPFAPNVATTSPATNIDLVLQNRDTDGDGLSDYDEIYVNKTSPYLEDSDSDGIPDKQEILQGTDPNCPQGKNCSAAPASGVGNPATSSRPNSSVSSTTPLNSSGLDQAALQSALNGQIDAATLRQLLLASGAKKEDLDLISDADLMKSYQDTLQKQSQNSPTP